MHIGQFVQCCDGQLWHNLVVKIHFCPISARVTPFCATLKKKPTRFVGFHRKKKLKTLAARKDAIFKDIILSFTSMLVFGQVSNTSDSSIQWQIKENIWCLGSMFLPLPLRICLPTLIKKCNVAFALWEI